MCHSPAKWFRLLLRLRASQNVLPATGDISLLQAPAQPSGSREISATKSCSCRVKEKKKASTDLMLDEFPFNQQLYGTQVFNGTRFKF